MNPSRELITDLLPVYFSGEASAETRALVEEFFAQDPEFERVARRLAGSLNTLKVVPLGDDEVLEKRTLMRTRAELRGRETSFGLAVLAVVAIFFLVTTNETRHSTWAVVLPVVAVVTLAAYALLARHTRNTGL
jgi:ferric-dicitrate binding protein FerR (iron transport regulator)